MSIRPRAIVYDVVVLGIIGLFCAMLGAYHGQAAGVAAYMLVILAYFAGRSAD